MKFNTLLTGAVLCLVSSCVVELLPAGDSIVQKKPPGVPESAEPLANWKVEDISAWSHENQLFLVLRGDPSDEIPRIPRLANVVRRIHWLNDTDTKLQVHPEPATWIIKSDSTAPIRTVNAASGVLVLTLDASPRVFEESIVCEPGDSDVVVLPAQYAVTHGETLRFEPQPHKNTVGYWSNEADFAEWQFRLDKAGIYEVDILQGCGKGHGGSRVELRTESSTIEFEVQETGHFQNFVWRTLGKLELKATQKGSLSLVPVHKQAGAVMDVRAVRLAPVGTKRSFEPELADPTALPVSR